jgi:hypothetical protein
MGQIGFPGMASKPFNGVVQSLSPPPAVPTEDPVVGNVVPEDEEEEGAHDVALSPGAERGRLRVPRKCARGRKRARRARRRVYRTRTK